MAIDPVSNGGPPGGLASLLPLVTRQPAPSANEGAAVAGRPDPTQTAAARLESANPVTAATQSQASPAPGKADIEDAVSKVQKVVSNQATNLLFSIDEDSGRTVVKVVDSSTKETIRQIPSEEILSIAKALDKLQGLLLKQTA